MGRKRGKAMIDLFEEIFSNENGLLLDTPDWVKRGIVSRIKKGKLIIVSAVCPNYSRNHEIERFDYKSLDPGVPFTADQHLTIMLKVDDVLRKHNVNLEYYVTLADTEFDLPDVVTHFSNGDPKQFLDSCEENCKAISQKAKECNISLCDNATRFTKQFPNWFETYFHALHIIEKEYESGLRKHDIDNSAFYRKPLYQAMSRESIIDYNYCIKMVKRQLAQYMTWGKCARERFGENLILMNHDTPNLSVINHLEFRGEKERIPIITLDISTIPDISE